MFWRDRTPPIAVFAAQEHSYYHYDKEYSYTTCKGSRKAEPIQNK